MKRNPLVLRILLPTLLGVSSASAAPSFVTVWKYSRHPDAKPAENRKTLHLVDLKVDENKGLVRGIGYDYGKPAGYLAYDASPNAKRSIVTVDHAYEETNHSEISQIKREIFLGETKGTYCYDILKLNQDFSLGMMVNRLVVAADSRTTLENGMLLLDPDRVTYVEAVSTMEYGAMKEKYGQVPNAARENLEIQLYRDHHGIVRKYEGHWLDFIYTLTDEEYRGAKRIPYYDVKTATAVLISGQTPEQLFDLPLATAIDGSTLKAPIDRAKYPAVWEVGRLASTNHEDLAWVLDALVLQARSELATLGKKLEDGYIFAHSPDAAHTRIYQSLYGMKVVGGYAGNDHEAILAVSLADLIAAQSKRLGKRANALTVEKLRANTLEKNRHVVPYGRGYFRDYSGGSKWVGPTKRREASIVPEFVKTKSLVFEDDAAFLPQQIAAFLYYRKTYGIFDEVENLAFQVPGPRHRAANERWYAGFTPELESKVRVSSWREFNTDAYAFLSVKDAIAYAEAHPDLFEKLVAEFAAKSPPDPRVIRSAWAEPLAGY